MKCSAVPIKDLDLLIIEMSATSYALLNSIWRGYEGNLLIAGHDKP
jgi:hypothetical protein